MQWKRERLAGDRDDQARDHGQRDGHHDAELRPGARMVYELDVAVNSLDSGAYNV